MDIKDVTRDSNGKLPAYAWPGGYQIIYLDQDNSVLCADCATKSLDNADEIPRFKPIAFDVYYEGPALQCDSCNKNIESAYGDPDADKE